MERATGFLSKLIRSKSLYEAPSRPDLPESVQYDTDRLAALLEDGKPQWHQLG